MNGAGGKVAGVAVGLIIVIIGFALFTQGAGIPQTPATTALVSVLVALGIGAIGAAVMPDTLTINGKEVKPLGLGGTATGGAAFFIATLVFLYATGALAPERGRPEPQPSPSVVPTIAPSPSVAVSPSVAASPAPAPVASASAVPPAPAPTINAFAPPVAAAQGPTSSGIVRVRTYCSDCCPAGPVNCANVGWGLAPTFEAARDIAVRYCVASGGHYNTCYADAEQY